MMVLKVKLNYINEGLDLYKTLPKIYQIKNQIISIIFKKSNIQLETQIWSIISHCNVGCFWFYFKGLLSMSSTPL